MGSGIKNKKAELVWIRNIRNGDHRAFEVLFKEYYFHLARFAWRYVKSKAIAEEIVQEIFSDIWENREQWEITGSVRSYLYKTVKNRSLDYLKHQRVRQKYDSRWMDQKENPTIEFEDEMRRRQIREAVRKAIEDLPPRSRMTYKLHRYDGLTYEEIAEVMEVSVKTVESQMTRTLKKLRERLSYLLPIFFCSLYYLTVMDDMCFAFYFRRIAIRS